MQSEPSITFQGGVDTLQGKMCMFAIPNYLGFNDPKELGRALLQRRYDLNRKDVEALECLTRGLTNGQLCEALGLADEKSASNRVQSILDKMGLRNRTQAAVVAAFFGLGTELLEKTKPEKETS